MYAEPSSDNEVRRLASGLYAEGRDYLLAIARANATGEADAEEALQEAFVSFIRHFDPGRGAPPLAWLTLTLKRECWGKRRRSHPDRHAGQETERGAGEIGSVLEAIPCPITGPEELAIRRDGARRRLGCLKPDQRTALILQAAGYSYHEIAAGLGWSYTKVNRSVNEGRLALRGTAA
jgi:DNA-directed RNA polymerase specialized sigma24 family protein